MISTKKNLALTENASVKAKKREADTRPVKLTDTSNTRLTFLQLTHRTCPHGYEVMYHEALTELGFIPDAHGNYWRGVGTPEERRTVFAAHLDTVGLTVKRVKHVFTHKGQVVRSDGKTILGADDKAGVTILLYMLHHNVPGTYALFLGEEVGCVGSEAAATDTKLNEFDAIVSFDRAGFDDVITHQAGGRTASDEYAQALANQLNACYSSGFEYKPCPHGVLTDSREFKTKVPECTNISVGYGSQHGVKESQDLLWLQAVAHAATQVKWSELPITRDPSVVPPTWGHYSTATTYGRRASGYWDDYDTYTYGQHTAMTVRSRVDDNLERVLGSSSDDPSGMVEYYEARYGIKLEDWSIDDFIEYMDDITEEQAVTWINANPTQVLAFLQIIAFEHPTHAMNIARNLSRLKENN